MQKKAQLSRHAIAGVIATASVAVMIWNMGGLGERVAWMLTLLQFGFLYLWTFWLSARARAVWVLVLAISGGVVMAHVLFWGPLLMGSYAIGLGPRHLDYALLAGLRYLNISLVMRRLVCRCCSGRAHVPRPGVRMI